MENIIVKKKNMGRQKIEIKKKENTAHLQVTFSRRRKGLFKKVEELCMLCGCDAAVLLKSPGGKPFSTGTPSVEHVINRYIASNNNNISSGSSSVTTTEGYNGVCENMHVGEDMKKKEIGNKQYFEELLKGDDELFGWNNNKSIDDMNLQELGEFKVALEGLKSNVMARANFMFSNSN